MHYIKMKSGTKNYFTFPKLSNKTVPKTSMAYTGLEAAKESKFKTHRATPDANPWSRSIGVLFDSVLSEIVHNLSDSPTVAPILTYAPL